MCCVAHNMTRNILTGGDDPHQSVASPLLSSNRMGLRKRPSCIATLHRGNVKSLALLHCLEHLGKSQDWLDRTTNLVLVKKKKTPTNLF